MPDTSETHEGGCLCGAIRYRVTAPPIRVTFCHCNFCQKVTGTAYAVEPIFAETDFELTKGQPSTYDHVSEGSGKTITLHFCETCASPIRYTFQRFDGMTGVMAGGFDDPNWFGWTSDTGKHIYLASARRETVIPASLPAYLPARSCPPACRLPARLPVHPPACLPACLPAHMPAIKNRNDTEAQSQGNEALKDEHGFSN